MSDDDDFDSKNARTWNERERAVYETGYAEGSRNENATCWALLDEYGVDALVEHVSRDWR